MMGGVDVSVEWEVSLRGMETSEIQIELTNRWMRRISIHHRQSEAPCFMSRRVFGVGSKLKGKTGKGLNSTGSLCVCVCLCVCACFCAERTILKKRSIVPAGTKQTKTRSSACRFLINAKPSNERRLISNKLPWRRNTLEALGGDARWGWVWGGGELRSGQRSFVVCRSCG